MSFWYFEIEIIDVYTKESEIIETNYSSFGSDYFEAWNKCIDCAKKAIDAKENPFHWVISSINDLTRQ